MEPLNWAALAIVVFLGATVLEAWIAHRRGAPLYAFGTAISDLACGSVFVTLEVLLKLLALGAYAWLFQHRLVDHPPGSWVPWVLGILGVDFLFYWWHRVSHVVNVLWAVHGVHHQSEDYNLAVALRQPAFEPITWFFFYAPLALLGVSPVVYLVAYAINRVYQFWIHTELVRKLPAWTEAVLNTPSHHRVHHGVQAQYLDRNYGAVLIVWDRLFGTFEPEGEAPRYGTTIPLRSYSPVWANFVHLDRVRRIARMAGSRRERVWAWVAHPAWLPRGVEDPDLGAKAGREQGKYRPAVGAVARGYVAVHFGIAGLCLAALSLVEARVGVGVLAVAVAGLVVAFAGLVGVLEGKAWALRVERWRVVVGVPVGLWVLGSGVGVGVGWLVVLGGLAMPGVVASLWALREVGRAEAARGGGAPTLHPS